MVWQGFQELPYEEFLGLWKNGDPAKTPAGYLPVADDVSFPPGTVRTRPGLDLRSSYAGAFINALFQAINPATGVRELYLLTDDGKLFVEGAVDGTATVLSSALGTGLTLKAATVLRRQVFCVSDGRYGVVPPLQWDGTFLRRLTPSGAAEGCVPSDSAAVGSITAGIHWVAVVMETYDGQLLPHQQLVTWNAAGGFKMDVANIQTGMAYVARRHIYVSPPTSAGADPIDLYRAYTIENNTSVGITNVDFSDEQLIRGARYSEIAGTMELPPCVGVTTYAGRLVLWNGRQSIFDEWGVGSPYNLSFDSHPTLLVGWDTIAGTPSVVTTKAGSVACAFLKGGDTIRNRRDNPAVFRAGVSYSWLVRVSKSAGCTTGTLDVRFLNAPHPTFSIAAAAASSTQWLNLEGLAEGSAGVAAADRIQLAAAGTPGGEGFHVDFVKVFETASPQRGSVVFLSRAEDPGNFNRATGLKGFRPLDGQRIGTCFESDDVLVVAKERALFLTRADGASEPFRWPVSLASEHVGTGSVHGASPGDGYWAIVGELGAWLYRGDVQRISDVVVDDWRGGIWSESHRAWVACDPQEPAIYVGIPYFGSTAWKNYRIDMTAGRPKWSVATIGLAARHGVFGIRGSLGTGVGADVGARRVFVCGGWGSTNVVASENYAFGPWTTPGSAPAVTTGIADPWGGTAAARWAFGAGANQEGNLTNGVVLGGASSFVVAVWLRGFSGSYTTFQVQAKCSNGVSATSTASVGPNWQRFVVRLPSIGPFAGTASIRIFSSDSTAKTIEVFHPLLVTTGSWDFGDVVGPTGGATSGWVAEFNRSSIVDWFQTIPASARFAPASSPVRLLVGGYVLKARGSGTLAVRAIRQDETTIPWPNKVIPTGGLHDIEGLADLRDAAPSIVIATLSDSAWWEARRLALMVKPEPFSRHRVITG